MISLSENTFETLAKVPFHRDSIKLFKGIGGTGFPACAHKGLNLKDIILIFFHKEHLGKLRVINVAPTSTRICTGWKACATSPKMNFASASFGILYKLPRRHGSRTPFNKLSAPGAGFPINVCL